MRGPVLGGHESEVNEVTAAQGGADGQTGERAFVEAAIVLGNLDPLIQGEPGVGDHERGKQLRDGGDGGRHVGIAGVQNRGVSFIDDQGGCGSQTRLIGRHPHAMRVVGRVGANAND